MPSSQKFWENQGTLIIYILSSDIYLYYPFQNMFVVILLDMMYSVTVYSVHTVLSNPCPFLCRKIKFLKLIAFIYLCKFYLFCITFIFLSISFYLIYLMHTNCCLELSFIHKILYIFKSNNWRKLRIRWHFK